MFRISDELKELVSYGFAVVNEVRFKSYPSNEMIELINHNFEGETRIYRGPSRRMQEFLLELIKCCPDKAKKIKRIRLEFWRGNQHRAKEGSGVGIIEADPIFDEIILESWFRWHDIGFGIYDARFRYDLSKFQA